MTIEIFSETFFAFGGIVLVFFGVVWTVTHAIKIARTS